MQTINCAMTCPVPSQYLLMTAAQTKSGHISECCSYLNSTLVRCIQLQHSGLHHLMTERETNKLMSLSPWQHIAGSEYTDPNSCLATARMADVLPVPGGP